MKILTLSLLLFSIGCVSQPTARAKQIIEADEKMVSNCKFLGNVDGSSTFGGILADDLHQSAKSEALEKAVQLNATHVVWTSVQKGFDSGASLLGNAYSCSK
ncbi:MAG: hypothetical protein H7061_13655 [Bdellovibrionaceae bacterium]|nr:hypothetical protein [Bdellovibrio sp.]